MSPNKKPKKELSQDLMETVSHRLKNKTPGEARKFLKDQIDSRSDEIVVTKESARAWVMTKQLFLEGK